MGSIVNTQQAEAWNGYEGERWADHFAQVSLASVEVPMKYGDDAMTAVEMFLSSDPVRFKLGEADRRPRPGLSRRSLPCGGRSGA